MGVAHSLECGEHVPITFQLKNKIYNINIPYNSFNYITYPYKFYYHNNLYIELYRNLAYFINKFSHMTWTGKKKKKQFAHAHISMYETMEWWWAWKKGYWFSCGVGVRIWQFLLGHWESKIRQLAIEDAVRNWKCPLWGQSKVGVLTHSWLDNCPPVLCKC